MTARFSLLALLFVPGAIPALADEMASPPPGLPRPAVLSVLEGWRGDDGVHIAGLRVTLLPEWKTYWRAPGDAGIPPDFDWSGSENWSDVSVHWPVPIVFETNGMTTIGYGGEVILPMKITPHTEGQIELDGDILLGVCRDICMPLEGAVRATLPNREFDPERDAAILAALDDRADTRLEAGVSAADCSAEPISDGMRITAKVTMPALGDMEHVAFELRQGEVWLSEAMTMRSGDLLTTYADAVPPTGAPFDVDLSALRLTVISQGRAVDISGCE